jgi:hypothetical protein
MSSRVPADRIRLLEDYADRVLAAVNAHTPEGRQPMLGKSASVSKYPVSEHESVWIIRSSGAASPSHAQAVEGRTVTACNDVMPEFSSPNPAEIIALGQARTETASITVGEFKYTRTTSWVARYRDNEPNLGFEWLDTSNLCERAEVEAPSPPDTEEAPSTSYSDGAIGGNEAPYSMVNGSWWATSFSTACYQVRNNVNSEVVVVCFLV